MEYLTSSESRRLEHLLQIHSTSSSVELEVVQLMEETEIHLQQTQFMFLLRYLQQDVHHWKALTSSSPVISLDVHFNKIYRVSIVDKKFVQRYCLSEESLFDIPMEQVQMMEKKKVNDEYAHMELSSLNCKINRKIETVYPRISSDNIQQCIKAMKYFRYKQRYSFLRREKDDIRIDMTIVKSSSKDYSTFRDSDTLHQPEKIEIEMEVIDPFLSIHDFINTLIEIKSILARVPCYPYPSPSSEDVLLSYYRLLTDGKSSDSVPPYKDRRCWIGPQVVSLTKGNISLLQKKEEVYLVTPKTDGIRCMGFLLDGKLYWIFQNTWKVQYSGIYQQSLPSTHQHTLVDGELVTQFKDGTLVFHYYVFDIYYYQNEDVRDLPFLKRYHLLTLFSESSLQYESRVSITPLLQVKTFSDYKQDSSVLSHLLEETSFPFETDGLIFTSMAPILTRDPLHYQWTGYGLESFLKWKPSTDLSIDFHVTFLSSSDRTNQSIQLSTRSYLDYTVFDLLQEKPLGLYDIYPFRPKNKRVIESYLKQYRPEVPAEQYSFWIDHYLSKATVCSLPFSLLHPSKNKILCKNRDRIQDGSIVEMYLTFQSDGNIQWVPRNVRFDKRYPNDFKNALQVWNSYFCPISNEEIKDIPSMVENKIISENDAAYYEEEEGGVRSTSRIKDMRQFHNARKRVLIQQCCQSFQPSKITVLELAIGRGGDISKWNSTNRVEFFVGIDIIRENIENGQWGACARYKQLRMKHMKAIFLLGDIALPIRSGEMCTGPSMENYDPDHLLRYQELTQSLFHTTDANPLQLPFQLPFQLGRGGEGSETPAFQIVSIQFAIHYFFQSKEKLDGLLKNIADHLQEGGYFIGTCLHGPSVLEFLGDESFKEQRSLEDGTLLWRIENGQEIESTSVFGRSIRVYIDSIGKVSHEYLVDVDYLIQELQFFHIECLEVSPFDPSPIDMSDALAEYSRLNCSFVFQKKKINKDKKKSKRKSS